MIVLNNCTWQYWLKLLLCGTSCHKHAVENDTQKRRPMCDSSNGLWAVKLTGLIQRAPNHPMHPSTILRTWLLPLQTRPKKQRWLHAAARRLGDDDDNNSGATGPWLTMLTVLQQGHQVKQGHEGHIEALIVQRGVLWELSVPTLLPLPPAVWRGIAQNAVKEGASNCRVDGTDLWS